MVATFIVILNGIIEGLTEFIPVSSTGHLILLDHFISFPSAQKETFQISIQCGAICAVLFYYRDFFKSFFNQVKKHPENIYKIIVAILPVFIAGFCFYEFIKTYLFNSTVVTAALIFGGTIMILVDKFSMPSLKKTSSQSFYESFQELSIKQAFYVGLFQLASLIPGMSRSGSTIVGGVLSKLSYKTAADFSFILSFPVIGAAVIYDLLKSSGELLAIDLYFIAIGLVVSFFIGLIAIKTVIKWISTWYLSPFGIYRIILGIGVILL